MAIGWMTILSNVPWSEVIKNAPAVAEGAKKLWKKVGSKTTRAHNPAVPGAVVPAEAQIAHLQVRLDELQAQMLATNEVVQALAEQNTQLITRVERHRRRLQALLIVNIGLVVLAVVAWRG